MHGIPKATYQVIYSQEKMREGSSYRCGQLCGIVRYCEWCSLVNVACLSLQAKKVVISHRECSSVNVHSTRSFTNTRHAFISEHSQHAFRNEHLVCVRAPELGKPEGRTAAPSAPLGMTSSFGSLSIVSKMNCHPDRSGGICGASLGLPKFFCVRRSYRLCGGRG